MMRPLLAEIGWSARELSQRIGVPERTVQQWVAGTRQAPAWLVPWLRRVAKALARLPPP
jgi:DNA-binding transcriptional regulator YdaS (Cro superfamily)